MVTQATLALRSEAEWTVALWAWLPGPQVSCHHTPSLRHPGPLLGLHLQYVFHIWKPNMVQYLRSLFRTSVNKLKVLFVLISNAVFN